MEENWINATDANLRKINVPIYTKLNHIPFGILSKAACEQIKAAVEQKEKAAAYFLTATRYRDILLPLYDRTAHRSMQIPHYKGVSIMEDYKIVIRVEDHPIHFLTEGQCLDFNCNTQLNELPIAFIVNYSIENIVQRYIPLFDREEEIKTIPIYRREEQVPTFHLSKTVAYFEKINIKEDEKASCAVLIKGKVYARFDCVHRLRLKQLFKERE